MPGLKDIAPSFATVKVRGQDIPTPGVSALGLAYLFGRFPEIRQLMGGKDVNMDPAALAALGPKVVAAIIACGTGDVNDKDAEAAAEKLSAEDQLNLLASIARETMPNGVGPFMEKLSAMFKGLGVESMSTADGPSPSLSKA